MHHESWGEWLAETILHGMIGVLVLAAAGGLLFGLYEVPVIIASIIGGIFGVLVIGVIVRTIKGEEALWERLRDKFYPRHADVPERRYDCNETLNAIAHLEDKYRIPTLTIMAAILTGQERAILGQVDQLDYVTWVGLINELSSVIQKVEVINEGVRSS